MQHGSQMHSRKPLKTSPAPQPESGSEVVPDDDDSGSIVEENKTHLTTPELDHLELQ